MYQYFVVFVGYLLMNNYVMSKTLGLCPFLGVSKRFDTAKGMGMAVIFVITMASFFTWLVNEFLLLPFDLAYMQTIAFILVIAVLVQIVESALKKLLPVLYQALGVYLPLITTNCVVLGVTIENAKDELDLMMSTFTGFAASTGFAFSLLLFACIREKLALSKMPKWMDGFPGALITAGLMAIAFKGFAGLTL